MKKKISNVFSIILLLFLTACELTQGEGFSKTTVPLPAGELQLNPFYKVGGIESEMHNLGFSAGGTSVLEAVSESGAMAMAGTYTPLKERTKYLVFYTGDTIINEDYISSTPVNGAGVAPSPTNGQYWLAYYLSGESTGHIRLFGVNNKTKATPAAQSPAPAGGLTKIDNSTEIEYVLPAGYLGRYYGGITKGSLVNAAEDPFFIIITTGGSAAAAHWNSTTGTWDVIPSLGFSGADVNYIQVETRAKSIYLLIQRNSGKAELLKGSNDFANWETVLSVNGIAGGKAHMDILNIGGLSSQQIIGIAYPMSSSQVGYVEVGEKAIFTSPTVVHSGSVGITAWPIFGGDGKHVSIIWMSISATVGNLYPKSSLPILSISTIRRQERQVSPPVGDMAATYFLGTFRRPIVDFYYIRRSNNDSPDTLIVSFYQKTRYLTAYSLYYQQVGIDGYHSTLETGKERKSGGSSTPVPGEEQIPAETQIIAWGGL